MSMRDIDGIATASVGATMWVMPVAEYLGIKPKFVDSTMIGGSSFVSHMLPAMMALEAGLCDAVLVCYGSNQRTSTVGRAGIGKVRALLDPQPYENPYQPLSPITSYALAAARHMHQYGTTREHLAEVAVAARKWAQLNPEAQMRDPLSIDDVLNARMVSDPLSVRDCCLVTDGAGAYVMVRADRAKDMAKPPVYVLGNATATWHRQISCMPDVTVTAAKESGERAFAMAGLKRRMSTWPNCTTRSRSTRCCSSKTLASAQRARRAFRQRRRDCAGGPPAGQHQRWRFVLRASGHVRHVHHHRSRAPVARRMWRTPGQGRGSCRGPRQRRHAVEPGHGDPGDCCHCVRQSGIKGKKAQRGEIRLDFPAVVF